jgi:hypothetical protein
MQDVETLQCNVRHAWRQRRDGRAHQRIRRCSFLFHRVECIFAVIWACRILAAPGVRSITCRNPPPSELPVNSASLERDLLYVPCT